METCTHAECIELNADARELGILDVDASDRLRSWDGPDNRDALLSELRDITTAHRVQDGDTLLVGINRRLSMAEIEHYRERFEDVPGLSGVTIVMVDDVAAFAVKPRQ